MIKVLMFCGGPVIPVRQGSDRLIHDVAKYLNAQVDIELTLAIKGDPYDGYEKDYAEICRRVVWIKEPGRWSVLGWVNKLTARIGVKTFESVGLALGMRRQVMKLARDADIIVVNYLSWFPIVPSSIRRKKAICLTCDLMYYRIASLRGTDTWFKRLSVAATKFFELRMFRTFKKIVVLGDYEVEMLRNEGYPLDDVICIGMPIEVKKGPRPSTDKKYDFFMISGAAKPNVDGAKLFLSRVVPLLAPRKVKFALAGNICSVSDLFDKSNLPSNCEMVKLGFIDDVDTVCSESRIGVAVVTAGSGIKVKTVELALRGLPIVSSNHGVEGVPVMAEGVINVDRVSENAIRTRLMSWLSDPAEAARAGRNQAEKVARAFAPETALAGLLDAVQSEGK